MPLYNPRAGSNDPELWNPDLAWYFTEFDSYCGLQSIGTSGAGQNQLRKPSKAEAADRRERMRNGFLLTLPDPAKADFKSTSTAEADSGAVAAMEWGVFRRGRVIWKRITQLPYASQQLLRRAYEERSQRAGEDWGHAPLPEAEVRGVHREYLAQ
jgi:hypothetical protein